MTLNISSLQDSQKQVNRKGCSTQGNDYGITLNKLALQHTITLLKINYRIASQTITKQTLHYCL